MKQKVENKIRELVPELMELSFGCEVVTKKENPPLVFINKETSGKYNFLNRDNEVTGTFFWGDFEIIGHPIHLEHVLRAVEIVNYAFFRDKIPPRTFFISFFNYYNLNKPFSEQSEDLYKFLAEVLGV